MSSPAFTDQELKELQVKITDLFMLVRKNIAITEGMRDRTWGLILEKTANDFNTLYGTEITLDTVYTALELAGIFDHNAKKS